MWFCKFLACGYPLRRRGLAPQRWQPSRGIKKRLQECFSTAIVNPWPLFNNFLSNRSQFSWSRHGSMYFHIKVFTLTNRKYYLWDQIFCCHCKQPADQGGPFVSLERARVCNTFEVFNFGWFSPQQLTCLVNTLIPVCLTYLIGEEVNKGPYQSNTIKFSGEVQHLNEIFEVLSKKKYSFRGANTSVLMYDCLNSEWKQASSKIKLEKFSFL